MSNQQMPANAVFMALASALGCLISELQKKGAVDAGDVVKSMQSLVAVERGKGDPDGVANYLHLLGNYITTTVSAPPKLSSSPSGLEH
jgi:hypothetical protein